MELINSKVDIFFNCQHLLLRYAEIFEYSSPTYNQLDRSGVIDRALSLTYANRKSHLFIILPFLFYVSFANCLFLILFQKENQSLNPQHNFEFKRLKRKSKTIQF